MSDPYASPGGWSTPVQSGRPRPSQDAPGQPSGQQSGQRGPAPFAPSRPEPHGVPTGDANGWSPAGPLPGRDQRSARRVEQARAAAPAYAGPGYAAPADGPAARDRGLPWWAALLLMIVIAAIGGVIDTVGSFQVRGGFNIGIIAASILAILMVRRSQMFPVVVAPPIVYSSGALFQLYLRSSGLHDRKVILDAAANYLVYGFPAIAAATAAVLIIAGLRLITRK